MPSLPTRSFQTIVATTVAAIQGRASQLIDFGQGSPLRAIVEGFAGLFLWFQTIALQLLAASRLSTSAGTDVDTFTGDFMPPRAGTTSPRLGAQAASGLLTFSRLTAASSTAFVAVGATAQTNDGLQNFIVTADPTLGTYSANPAGYTMAAGLSTLTVPASAVVAGAAGNVLAGTISVITYPVVGIDAVINSAAFINGADQESDAALKARFAAYILGLARGDVYGLTASVLGAYVNLQWTLTENYDKTGVWRPGYFFVVADDGSGAPPAAFIAGVTNAVYAVRPLGIQAGVFAPTIKNAVISMTITVATGYDRNTVIGLVAAAVTNGVNTLGLGNRLDFNHIPTWVYSVPGVTGISALLLNGLSGDAASISATLTTADTYFKMGLYTVKCTSCVVS